MYTYTQLLIVIYLIVIYPHTHAYMMIQMLIVYAASSGHWFIRTDYGSLLYVAFTQFLLTSQET